MGFAAAVRVALAAAADPSKAPAMQAYMKSEMPYLGVPKPQRAQVVRAVLAAEPCADASAWRAEVLDLWRGAGFREERYAAIDLTGAKPYLRWQSPDLLDVYEEMVVVGAWWDYVDEVASRRIGPLLRSDPAVVAPVMRAWADDADLWRRRTAIICQLGAGASTDLDLLTYAVESAASSKELFLRKAIGWALRQHARVDPAWVRTFVADHPDLSPLSRREALKHLH